MSIGDAEGPWSAPQPLARGEVTNGRRPTVAIVGMGHVGRGLAEVFPNAVFYDKATDIATKADVNGCDVGIVCTPTPRSPNGSADIDSIEEVLGWLETELIVIRSTVATRHGDHLRKQSGKRIVVAPEFTGEWSYPTPWEWSSTRLAFRHRGWGTLGYLRDCGTFCQRLGTDAYLSPDDGAYR